MSKDKDVKRVKITALLSEPGTKRFHRYSKRNPGTTRIGLIEKLLTDLEDAERKLKER